MGAIKKYKKYAVEEDNTQNKKVIEHYIKKIQQQLENDNDMQKKAASIIEQMMNSKNKIKK